MFGKVASSSLALIVAASPVMAEVTPVEVWDNLVSYYEKFGYSVTEGARDEAGDTLTVSDVTMTIDAAEAEGSSVSFTMPRVVLQQAGDGSVRTVVEGDITGSATPPGVAAGTEASPTDEPTADTGSATTDGADGESADTETADAGTDGDSTEPAPTLERMAITIAAPGNEMVSSGSPEAMSHELNYPTLDMTVSFETTDDQAFPVTFKASDLTGSYATEGEDATRTTTDVAIGEIAVNADMSAIESSDGGDVERGTFALTMSDVTVAGSSDVPEGEMDFGQNMNVALQSGAKLDGTFGWGAMSANFDFAATDPNGEAAAATGNTSDEGGSAKFSLSKDGISYGAQANNASVNLEGNDFPAAISYQIANANFDVMLPVTKSEEPAPFSLKFGLDGFALGDEVWALFDPENNISRDPASLAIDISGAMTVLRDLFDPEFTRRMTEATTVQEGETELTDEQVAAVADLQSEAMPYAPETVTVNTLSLDVAGASADISGELTVPEGGSFEAPVGTLTGRFSGVNQLIDTLAAMGLVPQEQVAGTKMMMMAFAKPVEGQTDTLTTELDFRDGGQIFANGQQIK
ncbi:DUF2125 domain-containing protein (plasmid) [Paracoccus sp. TK19116]|uniref:DUF2125 domain-containing protein n=1 Tax=Paracoccus albicereus TaxID=2922394 RepID=A0ABT1MM44_9RHOB|nr:DUF2125 domain-containing protein [Paracoccus albicereus]MCQ0969352.1 DUF2125 domain-containing protein [Paracoccus albicereus]